MPDRTRWGVIKAVTNDMRSVDDHLARVLAGIVPLTPIDMGLTDAHGCILAEDVRAPWPLPPFDNSAMDGYAVQAEASQTHRRPPGPTEGRRRYSGWHAPAGDRWAQVAARIMTGAPMPYGADTVVPVEHTDGQTQVVSVFTPYRMGAHVRRAGDDVHSGALVLQAGSVMDSRHTALAAAVGRAGVMVHPRPRVVVLTTGGELVSPGQQLGPGMINDVNGPTLTVAATEAGAEAFWVGPVVDDPEVLTNALEDQLVRADVVITTGGVSAGAYDAVKQVLRRLGTVEFIRVAMRPGMPQGFGTISGVPIYTCPGIRSVRWSRSRCSCGRCCAGCSATSTSCVRWWRQR